MRMKSLGIANIPDTIEAYVQRAFRFFGWDISDFAEDAEVYAETVDDSFGPRVWIVESANTVGQPERFVRVGALRAVVNA